MAKFKHNKKKNSAFLYETLILELTKSILRQDKEKKSIITNLIKESFKPGTTLYQDLKLYHSLSKTQNVNPYTAARILEEVKKSRGTIDKKKLLSEQNSLARKIKKTLSDEVLNNFVPSYKSLATIYQVFNQRGSIKTKVLLENEIIKQMADSGDTAAQNKMVPINNLVYKTFTKKFNKEYSKELLAEQKELLSKFVSSFIDNGLQLKLYLNEEIGRLKKEMTDSLLIEEFVADNNMMESAKNVIAELDSYKEQAPKKEMVQKIIKIQSLVHEIRENAPH